MTQDTIAETLAAAQAIVQREKDRIAAVKEKWDKKRKSGEILTSVGPAWLRLSADRKKWLEVPDKVHAVQRAFELADSGLGTPTIADKLNEENITTMSGGDFWQPELVLALLKNKSVIGVFTPKRAKDAEPIEGYYPPVIDKKQFDRVQEHIANRRRTGGRKGENIANLFSGLLRCECGARMRYVSANKPHLYLQCVKAYSGQGCDAPTMPYNAIEYKLMNWWLEFEGYDLGMNPQVTADPLIPLRVELAHKQSLIERMVQALNLSEAASLPTLVASMTRLEGEVADLQKQINEYVPAISPVQAVQEATELFKRHESARNGTPERTELRERLRAAFRRSIDKMVLRKATYPYEDGTFSRELVLYGPITKLTAYPEFFGWTDDGGQIHQYTLPAWGINGTRKRVEIKKRDLNVYVSKELAEVAGLREGELYIESTSPHHQADPPPIVERTAEQDAMTHARETPPRARTEEQWALLEERAKRKGKHEELLLKRQREKFAK